MYRVKKYWVDNREQVDLEVPKGSKILKIKASERQLQVYVLVNVKEEDEVTYDIRMHRVDEDIQQENLMDFTFLGVVRFNTNWVEYAIFTKEM